MLKAYFDESGTGGEGVVTAIAGFVGTADAWEVVEAGWFDLLKPLAEWGVSWFHMTDCVAGRGEFERVPSSVRSALIAGLTGVIARAAVVPVWAGVNLAEFERLVKPGSPFQKRYPRPYDLCFDEVVRQVCEWSHDYAGASRVALTFGATSQRQDDRSEETLTTWRSHPKFGGVLGPLAFDDPRQLVPLQAADLYVHQLTAEQNTLENGTFNVWKSFSDRPIPQFIAHHTRMPVGGLYGETGLLLAIQEFERVGRLWE